MIIALLAVVVVFVGFCVYFSVQLKYVILERVIAEEKPGYRYGCIYYNNMSRREQLLYEAVCEAAENCADKTAILPYKYTNEEFSYVMKCAEAENPELFYIRTEMCGLYTSGKKSRIGLVYCGTAENVAAMREGLALYVEEALKKLPSGAGQFEIERSLHDYIIRRCQLISPSSPAETAGSPMYNTAYGALVFGRATSDGYAAALRLLMNKRGLYCSTVFGKAVINGREYDHCWNLVNIDGNFYHTDSAWDDADLSYAEDIIFHGYFNLDARSIEKDHIITAPELLPEASDENNYYKALGLYISGPGAAYGIIERALRESRDAGRNYVELLPDYTRDDAELREIFIEAIMTLNSTEDGAKLKEAARFYNASDAGNAITVQIYYEE